MSLEIDNILKYNSEGYNLDFKKKEYPLGKSLNRNEFLKDISSFANHLSDSDKYIFIGIKEKNGVAHEIFELENITDQALYQEFLDDYIEPKINFEYLLYKYRGKQIAYFRIFDNNQRPYLFKKPVKNPITNKIDYKEGAGCIRVGTTTKKIIRQDLELIYENRFKKKDRKDDLDIIPHFKNRGEEYNNLYYIDFDILNKSNKSIEIEIELRIKREDAYGLVSENELEEKMREDDRMNNGYLSQISTTSNIFSFYNLTREENYVIISFTGKPIRLSQNSIEREIFSRNLIILFGDVDKVNAKVIIRSDSFTKGALRKKITFKK